MKGGRRVGWVTGSMEQKMDGIEGLAQWGVASMVKTGDIKPWIN